MNLDQAIEVLRNAVGAPLVVFDLETTGLDVQQDRIVQISLIQVPVVGEIETWTRLVNPEMPIAPGAAAVHGITDEMVAQARPFSELAREVAPQVNDTPLVAYNGLYFDAPILAAEMKRAEVPFTPGPIIDPFRIWKKLEGRNLEAALERFAGETLEDAHSAEADSIACLKVLAGMLNEFGGNQVPDTTPAGLTDFIRDPAWIDEEGKVRWFDGVACIGFGKHIDTPLQEMVATRPDYLQWILTKDFHPSTKAVIRAALEGTFPER